MEAYNKAEKSGGHSIYTVTQDTEAGSNRQSNLQKSLEKVRDIHPGTGLINDHGLYKLINVLQKNFLQFSKCEAFNTACFFILITYQTQIAHNFQLNKKFQTISIWFGVAPKQLA